MKTEKYVVICLDGHIAIGPFSPQNAVAVADRMTAEGKCTYVPVQFVEARQEPQETQRGTGGYL